MNDSIYSNPYPFPTNNYQLDGLDGQGELPPISSFDNLTEEKILKKAQMILGTELPPLSSGALPSIYSGALPSFSSFDNLTEEKLVQNQHFFTNQGLGIVPQQDNVIEENLVENQYFFTNQGLGIVPQQDNVIEENLVENQNFFINQGLGIVPQQDNVIEENLVENQHFSQKSIDEQLEEIHQYITKKYRKSHLKINYAEVQQLFNCSEELLEQYRAIYSRKKTSHYQSQIDNILQDEKLKGYAEKFILNESKGGFSWSNFEKRN